MFRTLLMRGKLFAKLPKSILASSNGCETWWSCSWCQYEAIEYLTCLFGHVSHPLLNFVYVRSSRLKVLHFWLDACIVNKGEKFELEMACWMHSEGFQVVSSHFWAPLCTGLTGRLHRFDRSDCWYCAHVGHRSDRWWWPVWPVWAEVLTAILFSSGLHAFVQGELHWFRGSLHVCRGSSLWFVELCFGGLRSLLELFVLVCFQEVSEDWWKIWFKEQEYSSQSSRER
jgi:hypothetical protein